MVEDVKQKSYTDYLIVRKNLCTQPAHSAWYSTSSRTVLPTIPLENYKSADKCRTVTGQDFKISFSSRVAFTSILAVIGQPV
jgi:hypothetical protein